MTSPLNLTRNQLAEMAPNQRVLKALEQLLKFANTTSPDDSDAATLDAQAAQSSASEISAALYRLADVIQLTATPAATETHPSVDYIDFSADQPHAALARRLAWNSDEGTLDLHHTDTVTQQVGYETYAYVLNNTANTLSDGSVVHVVTSVGGYPTADLFIADGSILEQRCIGVLTESIAPGAKGRANVYGLVRGLDTTGAAVGETWSAGDPLYASPTTPGMMTNVKPTAPNVCLLVGFVITCAASGSVLVRPVIEYHKFYASFSRNTDTSPALANTEYPIVFDNTIIASGFSLGSPASKIVASHKGLYAFTTSYQWTSSNSSAKTVTMWYKVNGVAVAYSTLKTSIDSSGQVVAVGRRRLFSLNPGDYVEIFYEATNTAVTLKSLPATTNAPASPACIVVIDQVQQ